LIVCVASKSGLNKSITMSRFPYFDAHRASFALPPPMNAPISSAAVALAQVWVLGELDEEPDNVATWDVMAPQRPG
jgi:hypothetical protein